MPRSRRDSLSYQLHVRLLILLGTLWLAASLAALSPLALVGTAHYCWALIGITMLFMLLPARARGAVRNVPEGL